VGRHHAIARDDPDRVDAADDRDPVVGELRRDRVLVGVEADSDSESTDRSSTRAATNASAGSGKRAGRSCSSSSALVAGLPQGFLASSARQRASRSALSGSRPPRTEGTGTRKVRRA
jgi:hypothetical protein